MDQLPPEDVIVETKVDDGKGGGYVQLLVCKGTKMCYPHTSESVNYYPTHWRYTSSGIGPAWSRRSEKE